MNLTPIAESLYFLLRYCYKTLSNAKIESAPLPSSEAYTAKEVLSFIKYKLEIILEELELYFIKDKKNE